MIYSVLMKEKNNIRGELLLIKRRDGLKPRKIDLRKVRLFLNLFEV